MSETAWIIALPLALFIVPITLITTGIIGKHWRLWAAFTVFLVSLGITLFERPSLKELGLSSNGVSGYLWPYIIATAFGIVVLIVLAKLLRNKHAKYWYRDWHFLFLFIPISIIQQFLYQAFLLRHLLGFFSASASVLITALIFGYMHTIYPHPLFSFFFGTAAGLFFGTLYLAFPSLILISISHMILNFTAVFFSFFTLLDEEGRSKRTELSPPTRRRKL